LVHRLGVEKQASTALLASSAGRGWSNMTAELRCHSDGVVVWQGPQVETEVCVVTRGSQSVVSRRNGSMSDRTVAARGAIWLSPAGLQGNLIDTSDPVPEILHIHIPSEHFSPRSLGVEIDPSFVGSLRYEGGFRDPLLAEIGYAIASELRTPTSAGRLLAETLAATLSARLVQNHFGRSLFPKFANVAPKGLDRRRLSRVLAYIEDRLDDDLTIDRLASVACLSRFHFVRAFKTATGRPPHRYVSEKRLERAKALLTCEDRSLDDIALALRFSCQANFTRAFRQATGQTPGQYRRSCSARS
jgi:AraC family transcriptional regulator